MFFQALWDWLTLNFCCAAALFPAYIYTRIQLFLASLFPSFHLHLRHLLCINEVQSQVKNTVKKIHQFFSPLNFKVDCLSFWNSSGWYSSSHNSDSITSATPLSPPFSQVWLLYFCSSLPCLFFLIFQYPSLRQSCIVITQTASELWIPNWSQIGYAPAGPSQVTGSQTSSVIPQKSLISVNTN